MHPDKQNDYKIIKYKQNDYKNQYKQNDYKGS